MDHTLRNKVIEQLNDIRPNKKVEIEKILARVRRLDLGPLSDFELNQRLLAVLLQLVEEGRLRPLPPKKKRDPITGLPHVVFALRPQEDAKKKKENQLTEELRHQTAWVPKMASFAYKLTKKEALRQAVKINNYLRTRKPDELRLPHRERALRIFGDEKALDGKPIRHGFFKGRIMLDDLDCFYCPEPLPFRTYSLERRMTEGKPLLVVENANTYWSCCQANETLRRFAAVVYGRGKAITAFEQACDGLLAIEKQVGGEGIDYFGDLDPEGIDIPHMINKHRHAIGLPSLAAAQRLYHSLLQKNMTTPCKPDQSKKHDKTLAMRWLGQELADRYLRKAPLMGWPQEGLTAGDIIRSYEEHAPIASNLANQRDQ
jgi:hypothetical protein